MPAFAAAFIFQLRLLRHRLPLRRCLRFLAATFRPDFLAFLSPPPFSRASLLISALARCARRSRHCLQAPVFSH
jgi:hypothetical protein